ncbi:MAG: hypothetical protein HY098_01480 [Nitrospinae bacterium]|nr:hypothetical protein [Nitrospinota bacterium]
MTGYWWECENCGEKKDFQTATGDAAIAHFLWDKMLPSSWDQGNLLIKCSKCKGTMRIAYEFPRKEKTAVRVRHIVGITDDNSFLQMMWETFPADNPKEEWFDFKYINERNPFGLNKPVVLSRSELQKLFETYYASTGKKVL